MGSALKLIHVFFSEFFLGIRGIINNICYYFSLRKLGPDDCPAIIEITQGYGTKLF